MITKEIMEIIKNGEYDVYGLRMDYAEYKIGNVCDNSFDWWQDDPEDGSEYDEDLHLWKGEQLDGTCAVKVDLKNIEDALRRVGMYNPGATLYLIAGYDWQEGNDIDEVIIRNAKVIMK